MLPETASVNAASPAVADDGFNVDRTGAGGALIAKLTAPDATLFGLATVIAADAAAVSKRVAGTAAVRRVPETYVDVSAV